MASSRDRLIADYFFSFLRAEVEVPTRTFLLAHDSPHVIKGKALCGHDLADLSGANNFLRNRSSGLFLPVDTADMVSVVALEAVMCGSSNESIATALVAQVAQGSQDALSRLYDLTSGIVYGLALRILRDPSSAEEVTLEVYLQVWRTAQSYDPQRGTVSSWLVTLVRSRSIDCLRARRARRAGHQQALEEASELRDPRPSPERASLEAGRARIVQNALAALPLDQRQAIELAYFGGLSHTEIASRKCLPLGTVKTRIRLGMLRLRELLGPRGDTL